MVLEYSQREYTKRVLKGKNRSFKILGEQSMVTYVVMDASAGLSEEDVEAFTERWGEKATEDLITEISRAFVSMPKSSKPTTKWS